MEFAQLAILAAAAGAGDREAQADILFMLIDKDHNQTIEYHELERFCQRGEVGAPPRRGPAARLRGGVERRERLRERHDHASTVSESRVAVPACGPAGACGGRRVARPRREAQKHYFREERRMDAITTLATCVPAAVAMAAAAMAAAAAAVAASRPARESCSATARPGPSSGLSSARRSPGIASRRDAALRRCRGGAPLRSPWRPRDGRPRRVNGRPLRPRALRRPRRTAWSTI